MDNKTEKSLNELLLEEQSFYERADALIRLLSIDNVADVLNGLPDDFRREFTEFAGHAYLSTSPRVAFSGDPLPEHALDALRVWLRGVTDDRTAAPTAVSRFDVVHAQVALPPPHWTAEALAQSGQ